MTTLASGASTSFQLNGDQFVTITTQPNTEGSLSVAPVGAGSIANTATNSYFGPPAVTNKQYGPYGQPVTITLTSKFGAIEYVLPLSNSGLKLSDRGLPSIAFNIANTYEAAVVSTGDTLTTRQKDAVIKYLPRLMKSSVYSKIVKLGLCFGNALAGSYVPLLDKLGSGNLTPVGVTAAGDYTAATGLNGNTTNRPRYQVFGATNLSAVSGITANEYGIGVFSLKKSWTTTGVLAGADSSSSGPYLCYANGVNESKIGNISCAYKLDDGSNPTTVQGRGLHIVQVSASAARADYFFGGLLLASGSGTPSGMPATPLSLMANNGSASFSQDTRIGGYVVFSPTITAAEALELDYFFEACNSYAGRTDMISELHVIGDSNSRGLGVTGTQRWSYLLAQMLGVTENNVAISGTTMSRNVDSNSVGSGWAGAWSFSNRYSLGANQKGALTVLSLGTNDVKFKVSYNDFISDYSKYMNSLIAAGVDPGRIIILNIPASTDTGAFGSDVIRQQQFNAGLQQLAAQFGCGYVDLFSNTQSTSNFQADKLHFNVAMHASIPGIILSSIATNSNVMTSGQY